MKKLIYNNKKRKNLSAIKQLQQLTQKKSVIDKIEKAEMTKKVLEKFPFLNKETAVSKNKFSSSNSVCENTNLAFGKATCTPGLINKKIEPLCCIYFTENKRKAITN